VHKHRTRTSHAANPRQIGDRLPAETAERPTRRRQNGVSGVQRRIPRAATSNEDRQQLGRRKRASAQVLEALARPVTAL
jgi:hypothetical protein